MDDKDFEALLEEILAIPKPMKPRAKKQPTKDELRAALATGGTKSEAGRLLGISRDTVRYWMDQHGL